MTHPALATMVEAAKKVGADTWDLVPATEHHGPYVVGPVGDVCDFYTMSNSSLPSTRNGGESYPVPFYGAAEHAAFIALANPANILSLAEYVRGLEEAIIRAEEQAAHVALGMSIKADITEAWVVLSSILVDARAALGGKP